MYYLFAGQYININILFLLAYFLYLKGLKPCKLCWEKILKSNLNHSVRCYPILLIINTIS